MFGEGKDRNEMAKEDRGNRKRFPVSLKKAGLLMFMESYIRLGLKYTYSTILFKYII